MANPTPQDSRTFSLDMRPVRQSQTSAEAITPVVISRLKCSKPNNLTLTVHPLWQAILKALVIMQRLQVVVGLDVQRVPLRHTMVDSAHQQSQSFDSLRLQLRHNRQILAGTGGVGMVRTQRIPLNIANLIQLLFRFGVPRDMKTNICARTLESSDTLGQKLAA
jgi:hypothetical protein